MRTVILIVALMVILASCSVSTPQTFKTDSTASSAQEVVDAWNLNCSTYGFECIPPGYLQQMIHIESMGDMYSGSDYATDSNKLMSGIQYEVQSSSAADPGEDELLIDVLNHPVWYM